MYYRTAECILMAFSLTNEASFDSLDSWMTNVEANATTANFLKIIVGLKSDMVGDKQVTFKEGYRYARAHGGHYFETSAKEGTNVNEMF